MNVLLTQELEQFILTKVDSGLYDSPNEVISEALRLLQEQDMFHEKLPTLRAEIQKGIDSGEATPLDIEDIIHRGKQRLAAKQKQ
jgi:antitoxin ParD1/3/4